MNLHVVVDASENKAHTAQRVELSRSPPVTAEAVAAFLFGKPLSSNLDSFSKTALFFGCANALPMGMH
jgi:hypothetical protein